MNTLQAPNHCFRWPAALVVLALCVCVSYSHSVAQVAANTDTHEANAHNLLGISRPTPGTARVNTGPFRVLFNPEPGSYIFLMNVAAGQTVKLTVQDDSHHSVVQDEMQVPAETRQVAVSSFNAPPGRYFVQLVTSTGTYVKNIVVGE